MGPGRSAGSGYVTGAPAYPLPAALKSRPQRLQNSLLIALTCALLWISVPVFSLVPTGP